MLDWSDIAIQYRLGLLTSDSLVRIAADSFEHDVVVPAAVKLDGLHSPVMAEAAPLFEQMCGELGIEIPSLDRAIALRLVHHLQQIVSRKCQPYDGLAAIMQELYFPHLAGEKSERYVGDSRGLEHLIGAYWGYHDLEERPAEISFDGKFGSEAIAAFDNHVRELAAKWLREHSQSR